MKNNFKTRTQKIFNLIKYSHKKAITNLIFIEKNKSFTFKQEDETVLYIIKNTDLDDLDSEFKSN